MCGPWCGPACVHRRSHERTRTHTDRRFLIAGNEDLLLADPLLDIALQTEDNNDDWLSKKVALLGLTEKEETELSVETPSATPVESADKNSSVNVVASSRENKQLANNKNDLTFSGKNNSTCRND